MIEILNDYVANPYLRALVVLLGVFLILKVTAFIIEKIVLRATAKTKTNIDDVFIKKVSRPLTVLILLIGLRVALEEIPLAAGVDEIFARIVTSVIILMIAYIIYLFVDVVLFVVLMGKIKSSNSSTRESLLSLVNSVLRVAWILIALLYILDLWGVEIGPLLAGLGIAGLAIALALQPTLANVFSGISILLDKSVKIGDLIYLDAETKGKISQVGLRSTRIITFDNELIIVPNTKLADSKIQNVALPEKKSRAVIPFGVAYGSDIDKVKKLILDEIKKVEHFISEPEPAVRFTEMGSSSLNFKAYFYVDDYDNRFTAIDEANTRIYNALNRAGISIPFPQIDVHIKEDKKRKKSK
ncbi:hypothetical protein CO038_00335 [Candidatus Pacearchaeota archaeon CG_4_9_14_0_2_um_filter_39_13]|nr:mechanosensitive ion channel family protein [Candidatus Pacearchaeota archaeon]OIO44013.1 MAG: hypothetical protein AUJ64_00920 [Candidatus Pacearchaeota archaeon CG1_02_39_14]PJC45121.1 MAG: hypothetical protein CO038_00335 [Candidatus Pacearchaeota archaeon CG_4_9_14_0_2_um_filter_39_13]